MTSFRVGSGRELQRSRRPIRGWLAVGLLATALVVVPAHSVSAAVLTVTSCGEAGAGSLRLAIDQANADPALDVIDVGACETIALSSPATGYAGRTVFKIRSSIEITNVAHPGKPTRLVPALASDCGGATPSGLRAFYVAGGAQLTLSDLEIVGFCAIGKSGGPGYPGGGGSAGAGGAVFNEGTLWTRRTLFSQNRAAGGTGGQAHATFAGSGGGAGVLGPGQTGQSIFVGGRGGAGDEDGVGTGGDGGYADGEFALNGTAGGLLAGGGGAGLGSFSGAGGFGAGAGGGVNYLNHSLTAPSGWGAGQAGTGIGILGSGGSGGSGAGLGGAIFSNGGNYTAFDTSFVGNSARGGAAVGDGGAGGGFGGAVFGLNADITVIHSSFAANLVGATQSTNHIHMLTSGASGQLVVRNSAFGTASTGNGIELTRTGSDPLGYTITASKMSNTFAPNTATGTATFGAPVDVGFVPFVLQPVGPTVQGPVPTNLSVLVDAAVAGDCVADDTRGFLRPPNRVGCDIGAWELTGPPKIPTAQITALTSTSVTLGISGPTPDRRQGYVIYRITPQAAVQVGCPIVDPELAACTDSGLTPGSYYQYRVYAWGSGLSTPNLSAIIMRTPGSPPAPPVGTFATATSVSSIRVGWIDASSNEDGFRVYRLVANTWSEVGTTGPNTTSFVDPTAPASSLQVYIVAAFNASGTTYADSYVFSTAWTGPAVAPGAPAAPTNFGADSATTSSLRVTWTDNANNESGYLVYRVANGAAVEVCASVVAVPNTTSCVDSGLASGTFAQYHVYAWNASGTGYLGTSLSAHIPEPALPAPSMVSTHSVFTVGGEDTSIEVRFIDNSTDETEFKLYEYGPTGVLNGVVGTAPGGPGTGIRSVVVPSPPAGQTRSYIVSVRRGTTERYADIGLWATGCCA